MGNFTFNLDQLKNAATSALSGATTNADGTTKVFDIKGPPGFTREQALEIFKKQADAGSLVGFKPGEVLSAATQAADGLPSAQAAVAQAQAGLSSALGSASGALAQAGGALSGSLAGTAAGLTALVGPAVSSIGGVGSALVGAAAKAGGGVGSALVGAAAKAGSVATSAIQTINSALTKTPLGASPINIADFTKTIPAVSSIGPMASAQVTGLMAQAKNLVGQSASTISNAKGIGEYGLDIKQLETAGYVKPGISNLLTQGASSLAAIAKSPASWTGKDGIKGLSGLLASPSTQGLIQQDLMAKGVAGLAAVGIPVSNLSAQGLAGMSLNAAKSLPNAEAFAKGLPIPGDATGTVKASMDTAVRDGAFAVNLVAAKIPDTFKGLQIPIPAADTVSRGTVDAASSRIAGNDKIPPVNYGAPAAADPADAKALLAEFAAAQTDIETTFKQFQVIGEKLKVLENQPQVSQQEFDAFRAEFLQIRESTIQKNAATLTPVLARYDAVVNGQASDLRGQILSIATSFKELDRLRSVVANDIANRAKELKKRIYTNVS